MCNEKLFSCYQEMIDVLNFPALFFILGICLASLLLLLAVWLTDYLKSSVTGLSLITISFCWLSFLICFLASFWKPNLTELSTRQFRSNIHKQKNELRKCSAPLSNVPNCPPTDRNFNLRIEKYKLFKLLKKPIDFKNA